MNPALTAFLAACVPTAAVAFCTWKILARIRQAVAHLEQHLGEPPEGRIDMPTQLTADHELRSAMDRAGFFAPGSGEVR